MYSMLKRVMIIIALICLTGCKREIFSDIAPREATRAATILTAAGILLDQKLKTNGNWSISVEDSQLTSAMQVLDQYRLTPQIEEKPEEKSLFPTLEEEKRFSIKKLTLHLEETIKSLPGVLDARVLLSQIDEPEPFEKQKLQRQQSASIVVFATPIFSVTDEDIRGLVSGASGVLSEQIHVILKKDPIQKIVSNETHKEILTNTNFITEKLKFNIFKVLPIIILTIIGIIFMFFGFRLIREYNVRPI